VRSRCYKPYAVYMCISGWIGWYYQIPCQLNYKEKHVVFNIIICL
jgi:hypothetical protein